MHQAYPQKDAQVYSLQNWRVYSAYFSPPTHEAKVTCAFKSSPQISRLAVREQTLPPCKAVQLYITSRESVCLHVNDWSQDQNKCRITFRKHLKIYKNGIHVFKNLFPTLCFQKVLQQFIINFRKFKKNVHMFQKQQFALSTSLNYTDVTAVHLEIYSTACPSVKTTWEPVYCTGEAPGEKPACKILWQPALVK